jgi:protein tyrosine phosphatase (PTP) superfamily phosphohydrolase (DUF442 family)
LPGIEPLPPGGAPPARPDAPPATPPRLPEPPPDAGNLPVDIPGFVNVREGVDSGRRPYPDGLDWLKARGYRTVVFLRRPGEEESADRRQVEKRGLRFVSVEVSPDNLTREVFNQFDQLVNDPGARPLFVYDQDGVLAGGMWYLHFRLSAGVAEEEALRRAGRLGLKKDQEGEPLRMWLAIQKLLGAQPPP